MVEEISEFNVTRLFREVEIHRNFEIMLTREELFAGFLRRQVRKEPVQVITRSCIATG